MSCCIWKKLVSEKKPAFFYGIPNSQNPSGITWGVERRKEVARYLMEQYPVVRRWCFWWTILWRETPPAGEAMGLRIRPSWLVSFSKNDISGCLRCGVDMGTWNDHQWVQPGKAGGWSPFQSRCPDGALAISYRTDIDSRIRHNARIYGVGAGMMHDIMVDCFRQRPGYRTWRRNVPHGYPPSGLSSMKVFERRSRAGSCRYAWTAFLCEMVARDDTIPVWILGLANESRYQEGMYRLSRVLKRWPEKIHQISFFIWSPQSSESVASSIPAFSLEDIQ